MQYKNFEIQIVDSGCIVRDSKGNFVIQVDSEPEAYDFIDDYELRDKGTITYEYIDLYDKFVSYCNKLPGKCFIEDNKLATTNEAALHRFAKSFEKNNRAEVSYTTIYRGGEYFHVVLEVVGIR